MSNNITTEQGEVVAPFNPEQAFKNLSEKQDKETHLLLTVMGGLVIFVVITFWIELSSMHRNYFEDKVILLQNNETMREYYEKNLFMNNEVQNIKKELEILRAKNPYLK